MQCTCAANRYLGSEESSWQMSMEVLRFLIYMKVSVSFFCPKVRYEQLASMVGLTGQMAKSQEEVEN